MQCRCTEALQQLALLDSGRSALLLDPSVVSSLEEVAVRGLSVEARGRAHAALITLHGGELLGGAEEKADPELKEGQVVEYREFATGEY